MNSYNAKADVVVTKESVRIETDHKNVRVLRSTLLDENCLSIADDYDNGGDPYNSTGQHVIIEPNRDVNE
jgi:hypothetical protein